MTETGQFHNVIPHAVIQLFMDKPDKNSASKKDLARMGTAFILFIIFVPAYNNYPCEVP
jgi:hypothetical protein